jgi:hypothetical protein
LDRRACLDRVEAYAVGVSTWWMHEVIGGAAIGIAGLVTALWCWWWLADLLLAADLPLVGWIERRRERRRIRDSSVPGTQSRPDARTS